MGWSPIKKNGGIPRPSADFMADVLPSNIQASLDMDIRGIFYTAKRNQQNLEFLRNWLAKGDMCLSFHEISKICIYIYIIYVYIYIDES